MRLAQTWSPLHQQRRRLEVRGGCGVVQMLHEGQVVAEHPRGTEQRLLIHLKHYEGEGDQRVEPTADFCNHAGQRVCRQMLTQQLQHADDHRLPAGAAGRLVYAARGAGSSEERVRDLATYFFWPSWASVTISWRKRR